MLNLDLFTLGALTQSMNLFPLQYGRISAMGIFSPAPHSTRSFSIDSKSGTLSLLPTTSWGGAATGASKITRGTRTITIPPTAHEDHLDPNDLQDVRAFGTEQSAELPAQKMAEKLMRMRARHDITAEYRRISALKGIIYDSDASTVLLNLFTEFNVSQKSVDFVLGTSGTEVREKCLEVSRWIEDNLLGDTHNGVSCQVSAGFFDKFTKHATVKAAFANYQEAAQRLGGDMRSGFTFGGLTFQEYRAKATTPAGSTVKFITDDEGMAFPLGTQNTFSDNYAPADFMETVNTLALPFYGKAAMDPMGRGLDLHTQSNHMPFCSRPIVLVRLHSSN